MSEPDKPELDEKTLEGWLHEATNKHTPPAYRTQGITANRLKVVIDALRATRQELAKALEGCAWAYQYVGATGGPVKALDNLSAICQKAIASHPWPVTPPGGRISELEQQLALVGNSLNQKSEAYELLSLEGQRLEQQSQRDRERIEELEKLVTAYALRSPTLAKKLQARTALAKEEDGKG